MTLDTAQITNIAEWVDSARSDPNEYQRRQVVEITLSAIAINPDLREHLLLKGGTLMALAYGSPRFTMDVDFTAVFISPDQAQHLIDTLNDTLPIAARNSGYLDLECRVQSMEMKPRSGPMSWPTLEVKIGSARRGNNQIARLNEGLAAHVTKLEISFNEHVETTQHLTMPNHGHYILAYSIHELIAEKFRALLQQPIRNRARRQDVYDISRIVKNRAFDDRERSLILKTLALKAKSRNVPIGPDALSSDEVKNKARSEYHTLQLEIDDLKLDFDADFGVAETFYKSLPWDKIEPN
jgi:predicted nucleotidyltransferase component of viral defense system